MERKVMLGYFFGERSSLDIQIEAIVSEMQAVGLESEKYPPLVDHLERLTNIKKNDRKVSVSPDTVAIIAGNLLGILLIIVYEQKHVMTSKGFSQLIRPR